MKRKLVLAVLPFVLSCLEAGEILRRHGEGYLEKIDGLLVLHVQGTPYRMGYQHGKLLRDHVRALVGRLLREKGNEEIDAGPFGGKQKVKDVLKASFRVQKPFYKKRFLEELRGLAEGAGLEEEKVLWANHLPELFHCSGFALMREATSNGEVYHGRVLDYATDWGLQDHAVVIVAEPESRNAFANVTFAGFIGSVTGLNEKHISIGEMGGGGQPFWAGEPMSFLVRRVLEEASSLKEAVEIFKTSPRTCQYYYVIADGMRRQCAGLAATWRDLVVIEPGEYHPLLPDPVKDCVLLSAGERYKELVRRTRKDFGAFNTEKAIRLMDAPVAMGSNLHDVLMCPKSGDFYAAYAGKDGEPACKQKYVHLNLFNLLGGRVSAEQAAGERLDQGGGPHQKKAALRDSPNSR